MLKNELSNNFLSYLGLKYNLKKKCFTKNNNTIFFLYYEDRLLQVTFNKKILINKIFYMEEEFWTDVEDYIKMSTIKFFISQIKETVTNGC